MKKLIISLAAAALALCLAVGIAGCGKTNTAPGNDVDAAAPVIITQPTDISVRKGAASAGLEVKAYSEDNGSLGYQWFSSASEDGEGEAVENADKSYLAVDTSKDGTTYYWCVVTNTNSAAGGNKTASVTTNKATVKVWSSAETPRIVTQPKSSNYVFGAQDEALPLEVEAAVSSGVLSYQWYKSATGSYDDAVKIETANVSSYVPAIGERGSSWYFCEITNRDETASESVTSVVRSSIACVSIDYDYTGFEFEATGDTTCKLTAYSGDSLRPYIPDTDEEGRAVTEIGAGVFAGLSIVEITVPSTVTKVGVLNSSGDSDGSFYNCSALRTFNFGGSFEFIGDHVFSGCSSLETNVWAMCGELQTLGRGAFQSVNLPADFVIPATLTGDIGSWTFQNAKGMENVTFAGQGVTYIGGSAFGKINSLKSVTVPASVTKMGDSFSGSSNLESVTFERSVKDGNMIAFDANPFGTTEYTDLTIYVPDDSYDEYSALLGNYAKYIYNDFDAETPVISKQPQDLDLNKGTSAQLEITATTDDGGTLSYQWYETTDADDNTGGSPIDDATANTLSLDTSEEGTSYYYCVVTNSNSAAGGNKTATVTSNVATVTVTAAASVPVITAQPQGRSYVFADDSLAEAMSVNATVEEGTAAYRWFVSDTDSYLEATEIPEATQSSYTPKLEEAGSRYYFCEVTCGGAPETAVRSEIACITVESDYGDLTFETIGDTSTARLTAWSGDTLNAYVPATDASGNTVVEIGKGAFANKSITNVTLPDTVTTLGVLDSSGDSDGTFYNCTSLKTIEFDGSFKFIGDHVFSGCSSLETDVWQYCTSLVTLGKGAFQRAAVRENIEFPSTLEGEIGSWTFQYATGLKNVTFAAGSKVSGIEGSAFAATTLETIVIPASVTAVGNCLRGCTALTSVTFERSVGADGSITSGNPFEGTYTDLTIHVPADSYDAYVSAFGDYGQYVEKPAAEEHTLTITGATVNGESSMKLMPGTTLEADAEVALDDSENCLGWLWNGGYYADWSELAEAFSMTYGDTEIKALYEADFTQTFTPSCVAENLSDSTDVYSGTHTDIDGRTGTRYAIENGIDIKIINGEKETHGQNDGVFNSQPLNMTERTCLLLTFVNNADSEISFTYVIEYFGDKGTVSVTLGANETKTEFVVCAPAEKTWYDGSTPHHQIKVTSGGENGYDISIVGRLPV